MGLGGKFVVYTVFKAIDQVQPSLKGIKSTLGGLSMAMTGIGAMGVMIGAKFERAMNVTRSVIQSTGDLTATQFDILTKKAREVAGATEKTPEEVAKSMERLARSGKKHADILEMIEPLTKGAIANNAELDTTTRLLISTMNAFGLQGNRAKEVMDSISYTTLNTASDVEFLNDVMQYASAPAKNFGVSYKDTMLMGGILGGLGFSSSRAGTQLKTQIQNIVKNADKLINKYGVDVIKRDEFGMAIKKNVNGTMVNQMEEFPKIMSDLANSLKGKGDLERMQAYLDIFGKISSTGASALSSDFVKTDEFKKLDSMFFKLQKTRKEMLDGTTEKAYKTLTKGTYGSTMKLVSALQELAIVLTQKEVLESINYIVQQFTGLVSWISKSNDGVKTLIKTAGLLAISLKPLMMAHSAMGMGKWLLSGGSAVAQAGAGSGVASGIGSGVGSAVARKGGITAIVRGIVPAVMALLSIPVIITMAVVALAGAGIFAYMKHQDTKKAEYEKAVQESDYKNNKAIGMTDKEILAITVNKERAKHKDKFENRGLWDMLTKGKQDYLDAWDASLSKIKAYHQDNIARGTQIDIFMGEVEERKVQIKKLVIDKKTVQPSFHGTGVTL